MLSIARRMMCAATIVTLLGMVETCARAAEPVAGEAISFELDIMPILTARGCNAGACHGKQRGQNGFQLSLLGFDAEFDFVALTREGRGRRVFPADSERSLLLRKGAARMPHGGGVRLPYRGADYVTLQRWIERGTPRRIPGEPTLSSVTMVPDQKSLRPEETQQLKVTAHYSDGSQRDVTSRTTFQSNEAAVVGVTDNGMLRAGTLPGEASIMARFMGQITTCNVTIPLPGEVPEKLYEQLPRVNFVDGLVWKKLQQLGITPSDPSSDSKYMRRVYLDIAGRLPSTQEVREFLSSTEENKRARLVDHLLELPEFGDHWANKWADLLRPNPYRVGIKAVLNYDAWIRASFRQNKPYDQFVRDLITARGSTWRNGAATLFRDRRSPDELTPLVSQLFLGIRLECAKCHHHPFEKWGQTDFFSFAAYFARLGRKGSGLSPPISGGEEVIMTRASGTVSHPLTGKVLPPRPLYGTAPELREGEDPRVALARWITSKDNAYFSQVAVNRVWADLMGRGLVEPVDDLRATNPPSNGPLLEALANSFVQSNFDLKQLLRTITASYVYALSSQPTERNISDIRNYSRHYRQRLRAEVLLDTVSDISGVPETFPAMPQDSRATQIWTHRVSSLFLDTFGRPDPNQDPPCERTGESTVAQTLHLMNAPALHSKVTSDEGRAAQLASSDRTSDAIVEELYLMIYSRLPEEAEVEIGRQFFSGPGITRRGATEDLMWALMNTPEFVFKD